MGSSGITGLGAARPALKQQAAGVDYSQAYTNTKAFASRLLPTVQGMMNEKPPKLVGASGGGLLVTGDQARMFGEELLINKDLPPEQQQAVIKDLQSAAKQ